MRNQICCVDGIGTTLSGFTTPGRSSDATTIILQLGVQLNILNSMKPEVAGEESAGEIYGQVLFEADSPTWNVTWKV